MPASQNQTVRFGPFELDAQCGELRKSGIRLKLQGQPIQILEMLLAKPGELVTREDIQQRLWSADTFVDFDLGLNTAVRKLRQALATTPRRRDTSTRCPSAGIALSVRLRERRRQRGGRRLRTHWL